MTFTALEFYKWRAELRRRLQREQIADRLRRNLRGPVEEPMINISQLRRILKNASSYEEAEAQYRRATAPRA